MEFKNVRGYWKIKLENRWCSLCVCIHCFEFCAIAYEKQLLQESGNVSEKIKCCGDPLHIFVVGDGEGTAIEKFIKEWED